MKIFIKNQLPRNSLIITPQEMINMAKKLNIHADTTRGSDAFLTYGGSVMKAKPENAKKNSQNATKTTVTRKIFLVIKKSPFRFND